MTDRMDETFNLDELLHPANACVLGHFPALEQNYRICEFAIAIAADVGSPANA